MNQSILFFVIIIIIIIIIIFCYKPNGNDCSPTNYTPVLREYFDNITESSSEDDKLYSKKELIDRGLFKIILNPDDYIGMVKQLLKDISQNEINVSAISKNNIKKINYSCDVKLINNFLNDIIKQEIDKQEYLQQNGNWGKETFHVSDTKVYYFEVTNENNKYINFPAKFNLFKLIFTLDNRLRNSSTECYAFITVIDNKMTLQYTDIINSEQSDTFASDSELNNKNEECDVYIFRDEYINKIKADIPEEFKSKMPPLNS